MADQTEKDEVIPLEDARRWLRQEILDSSKAFQLRVQEATGIVSAYAAGEISPAEATKRLHAYDERWGDALFGTSVNYDTSDREILARVDKARQEAHSRFQNRLGQGGTGTRNPSR